MKFAVFCIVGLWLGYSVPAAETSRPDVQIRAERAYAEGRYAEAIPLLEAWLRDRPDDGDARVRLGWARYRLGEFHRADAVFREAVRRDPASRDARTGLGYARLQLGDTAGAAAAFREVLAVEPDHRDALRGMGLAARRDPGESLLADGLAAARRLESLGPADAEAALVRAALERRSGGPGETRRRPDAARSQPLDLPVRAGRDYLELAGGDGRWRPFFVKGINLGAALPGRHPTEFPTDEATWASWLDTISGFGANTVRVYTLLPPAFYSALRDHNARAGAARLWLVQGVWTELPPGHDFADATFTAEFEAEIARVIDAVHGDLVLAPRPGHASGIYDADASGSLLAWIVGREWEPFAVVDFDALHPSTCSFEGAWFEAKGVRAMECWTARVLDFAAGYEQRRHRALRPTAFANWPTLDPLVHPTESTRAEEDAWRRRRGIAVPAGTSGQAWDNDAVALDATLVRATAANPAGTFASYHVYPNFPDFMNNDPALATVRDAEGVNRYAGYLRALKAYHRDQPVLVAEFGMSTSRGVAHVHPEGWNHGGMDEREAGALVARMLRSIRDERCAGGIVFEFQDEWFKGTWSVAPFEVPWDRRRVWFNPESPEQSYGLVAHRPEAPVVVDGDPGEWPAASQLASAGRGRCADGWARAVGLSAASDEGWLYLKLDTCGAGAAPDWSAVSYAVAIDTYDAGRGERRLPAPWDAEIPTGAEFLVTIAGPGRSRVLVTPTYDPDPVRDGGPLASPRVPSGRFVPLVLEANRERIARDGTVIPAIRVERGTLRFGSLDPRSPRFDTRTDVAIGEATGTIEIRIPWGLLDFADPSTRRVLHQETRHAPPFETARSDGLRLYAWASRAGAKGRARLDGVGTERGSKVYLWPTWEQPRYRTEPKAGAEAVRRAMVSIPDLVASAGTPASETTHAR